MRHLVRCTVSLSGAIALLAGCSTRSPVGAPGVMPQSRALLTQSDRGRSWMREAKSGDLLYVSQNLSSGGHNIEMLTYPGGKLVGTITGNYEPWGLCSDTSGDVWVPTEFYAYEYAHGGTTPIASLYSTNFFMTACAVDPTTGNLAVVGEVESGASEIAIWPGAQGTPTFYSLPFWGWALTFDSQGNLFIDGSNDSQGFLLSELPYGSGTLTSLTLDQPAEHAGGLQWDGKYLAIDTRNPSAPKHRGHVVYRVQVSGSGAHVVDTIHLKEVNAPLGFWIQGDTMIGVHRRFHTEVNLWRYPRGGKPFKRITGFGEEAWGITVSVPPSGSHIRK